MERKIDYALKRKSRNRSIDVVVRCTQVQHAEEDLGREKRTLTLNFGFVYHVMNSTCIQYEGCRPKYIHVQALGNMHKTPLHNGETTKITYTSNSFILLLFVLLLNS